MESATGKIRALNGSVATVAVAAPVACQRCADGNGCGAGIFQTASRSREIEVLVPAGLSLSPGDTVELTIAPKFLLRAAMLAYGLPLVTMVLFVACGWWLLDRLTDGAAIVLAIVGLAGGLIAGRQVLSRESVCEQFVPALGRADDV